MLYLKELIKNYPILKDIKEDLISAYSVLRNCFFNGGKLLIAGNGGSSADADHIVGELMKGFKEIRNVDDKFANHLKEVDSSRAPKLIKNLQGALPSIALSGQPSLTTAYANDCDPSLCFAQQVYGYGNEGDVFLAISTSGNSENIIYAAVTAKAKGIKVIGMTGAKDSILNTCADICIRVPETETYRIQELHVPVYHCLCLMIEATIFGNNSDDKESV